MLLPDASTATTLRERVLLTAAKLFYREGIRSVGIDRIIAESGAAKASFYRHFKSKDDLVLAYLYLRHERWMQWFTSSLERACDRQGVAFARVADVLAQWFREPDFRGCSFINALAEGSPAGEVLSLVQSHKAELQDVLEALAKRMSHPSARAAAEEALLIVEGAIVRAQTTHDLSAVPVAARLLARLDAMP
jgi:AcrR family transcriptional regulator